jgi:GMP synthase-like glutamine amidotransferase
MEALVLQHIACEPPGVYEDVMRERGLELVRVELDEGEPLPDWREFDLIIAMGGPMSVNEDARLPWLKAEKRLIHDAVRARIPFFGACLGAQLLAASLGGRVYEGPRPEVGFLPVELTDAARRDPLFAPLPVRLITFQWHGDTFTLPRGSVRLAASPAYRNQAFRWGKTAYGVQFHLEVSAEMAQEWAQVPEYAAALERVLGATGAARVLDEFEQRADALAQHARGLFERWLEQASLPANGRLAPRG